MFLYKLCYYQLILLFTYTIDKQKYRLNHEVGKKFYLFILIYRSTFFSLFIFYNYTYDKKIYTLIKSINQKSIY
jgi:hypothetical protein